MVEKVTEKVYHVDVLDGIENGIVSAYILDFDDVAIIDPGPASGYKNILKALDELGIEKERVKYLVATHIHIDHSGNCGHLVKELPEAKVVVHPKGAKHLIDPERLWVSSKSVLGPIADLYEKPIPVPESKIMKIGDMEKIDLGGDTLLCMHAPGHTAHHVAYYLEGSKVLFPSDAAGVYTHKTLLPATPPPFELDQALKSLEKLMELDVKFVAFTHFGASENGKLLKRAYDKLVSWAKIAEEVVKEGGDHSDMFKRLMNEDEDVKGLAEKYQGSDTALGHVLVNIFGMLDYVRRKQA